MVDVFKNCFLFLKTKNTKNMFGKGGCVFAFCVSHVLKNHFLKNNKNMFLLFFHCSANRLFYMFFHCSKNSLFKKIIITVKFSKWNNFFNLNELCI